MVNNPKGQKRVLEAFEILVSKVYPQLMPKVPLILKAFYDFDILEEEVVLEWHEKVCACTCMSVCICVNVLHALSFRPSVVPSWRLLHMYR